ncbi:MAG TPA: ornithine cyclodeaminase [Vicinamibacteria bacterium]|nr:ornithine cyclodeaminase [Vicinamibacteria bacterium]
MKIRIISKDSVKEAVSMAQAIETVKAAFAQLSGGQARVPIRTQLPVPSHDGVTLFMPAYLEETDELGMKMVSVFSGNPARDLPAINAMVVLVDAGTGLPTAILDGTYLTALRTGAASGAATDLLARADASTVAVLGTGVQGRTQLEAVCTTRRIERVLVYDTRRAAAEAFCREMASFGAPIPESIELAPDTGHALREADIVCTATTSSKPVFADAELQEGAHINAIGAFTPQMQEIPVETVARSLLVVDSREAVWAEAGDLIIARDGGFISTDSVHAELGEVVLGSRPGRTTDRQVTLFKSVGNAVQDVSVGARILKEAEERGLGEVIEI